jgi:hypothetical protein
MVERLDLRREELATSRAAKIAAEIGEGIVEIDADSQPTQFVNVKFDSHAPLVADYLIRQQGFKTAPTTGEEKGLTVYKLR